MPSILSMVRKCQSGLRIMYWQAMVQVRLWQFLHMMNVTMNLQRNLILPIIEVVAGGDVTKEAYTGDGQHVNSEFLNGLNKEDSIRKMIEWLEEKGIGTKKVTYRLRDWLFSRQRYWGEPIPIIHWEDGTMTAVPEDELPLVLPETTEIQTIWNR